MTVSHDSEQISQKITLGNCHLCKRWLLDLSAITLLTTRCCHFAVVSRQWQSHVPPCWERGRRGEREGVCGTEQLVKFCHTLREEAGQLGKRVCTAWDKWVVSHFHISLTSDFLLFSMSYLLSSLNYIFQLQQRRQCFRDLGNFDKQGAFEGWVGRNKLQTMVSFILCEVVNECYTSSSSSYLISHCSPAVWFAHKKKFIHACKLLSV